MIDRRRFTLGTAALALAASPLRAGAAASLDIGYVPVLGAAPLVVLARSGLAAEAGLDIGLVKLDPIAATPPTLDVVATGVAPIVRARAAGSDLRIAASLATAGAGFVAVPALATHFYANANDPAKAFAAFRKKAGRPARLATTPAGFVPHVLLEHWLFARNAVPRDLVEIAPMDLAAMETAIVAATADGATLPEPMSTILRSRIPRLQRITSGSDMFPDMPGIVLGIRSAFADANPDTCRALVRGIAAATRMIRESPADAAPLLVGTLGAAKADAPLMTRALASSNLGFVTDPHAIEESTRRLLAYQALIGDFPTQPDVVTLFDERFYDKR